jgi:predicted esterase
MNTAFPPSKIVEPQAGHKHTHTLILLHGRGSTADEFAEDLLESRLTLKHGNGSDDAHQTLQKCLPTWRLVFPSSKDLYSDTFKEEFPQWFDTASTTDTASRPELQIPGLRDAVKHTAEIVNSEVALLEGKYENVVLGGISMGCATAIWTLLSLNKQLGGFVGASGWLPFASEITKCFREVGHVPAPKDTGEDMTTDDGRAFVEDMMASTKCALQKEDQRSLLGTSVFLGHGTDDQVIDVELGKQARDSLEQVGFRVDWKEYEGAEQDGHWLKEPEEVDDIVRFLQEHTESG